jgi:hypothetical protein
MRSHDARMLSLSIVDPRVAVAQTLLQGGGFSDERVALGGRIGLRSVPRWFPVRRRFLP